MLSSSASYGPGALENKRERKGGDESKHERPRQNRTAKRPAYAHNTSWPASRERIAVSGGVSTRSTV